MTQQELNREVATATGESVSTVANMGFVPLTRGPFERDREPLTVDWDAAQAERPMLFPLGD